MKVPAPNPPRIVKAVTLAFALAALAAPTALAEPRSLNDIDPALAGAVRKSEAGALSPDDRALYRGNSPVVPSRVVSPDDRSVLRGVQTPSKPTPTPMVVASDDFQWGDAGLGAATMFAFMLVAGAAGLVVRHQRRRLAAF